MYRSPPREEESQLRERIQQLRSDLELAQARADMWREQAKVSRLKLRESKKRRSKPPSKFVRPPRPKPKRFVEQRLRRENAWLSQEQDRLRSELQDARTEQSGVATPWSARRFRCCSSKRGRSSVWSLSQACSCRHFDELSPCSHSAA